MPEPRTVVITGASRGLGLASAAEAYRREWRVVAAMRSVHTGLAALREKIAVPVDDSRLVGVALHRRTRMMLGIPGYRRPVPDSD